MLAVKVDYPTGKATIGTGAGETVPREKILASLKAQVFLDNKLYYAAYREAWAVIRTGQAPVEACAIVQASVRSMGLKKTPLWDAVQEAAGVAVRGYRGRYGPGPRR